MGTDRLVCGLDVNHNEFDLAACARFPAESHELALYVYCNTPARDVFLRVETAGARRRRNGALL